MRKLLTLLLLFTALVCMAKSSNEYFDLLKAKKIKKLESKVNNALEKNPDDINANLFKAQVFLQKEYAAFNPDSAYRYCLITKDLLAAEKDKAKLAALRKLKVNASAINKVLREVYKLALEKADAENTEDAYKQFLKQYPDAGDSYKLMAANKIEALYYSVLGDSASIESYQTFIANRPDSPSKNKAKFRLHELEFARAEAANTKLAYKYFVDNYKTSKQYPQAYKKYKTMQYLVEDKEGCWCRYSSVIEAAKSKEEVAAAEDSLLAIAKRTSDIDLLKYCVSKFTGLKRNRAFMMYHDIFTNDGELATLDLFYRGNADPLFSSLRVVDYNLAYLGDSLSLGNGYDDTKFVLYDRYIKQAAPRERAFVALQKYMAKDIAAKRWEVALEKLNRYRAFFGERNHKIEILQKLLEAKTDNSVKITSVGSGVNTISGGEYVPVLAADDKLMYFCGKGRKDSIGGEDIYVAKKIDNVWTQSEVLRDLSFSNSNDAPLSVSADGTTLLLFISGKINYAKKTAKSWMRAQPYPYQINSEQWQADAMISSDGRAMLFASIRKGGYNFVETRPYHGSNHYWADIYVSVLDENNEWGVPINLGSTINTPYCDRMPFLHPDMKTLYFSSDGHAGLGGLDVYKSTRLADSCWNCWSEPINLGKDVNTDAHDWGYKISTDGEKAYFARGTRGERSQDIYSLNLPVSMRPNMVATISGKISNSQNQFLEAEIVWEDLETGEIMGRSKTDPKDGSYFVVLPLGKMYGYYVEKEGYYPMSDNVDLRKNSQALKLQKDIKLLAILEMIDQGLAVPITNLFFNTNESVILPYSIPELQRVVNILKTRNLKVEISGHTDNVGDEKKNQNLSENRAIAVKDFFVKAGFDASLLSTKGYGASKPIADNKTEAGRAKNRRVELRIVK